MRNMKTKKIALCGLFAAVAIVIMCLVGMIPVATYVCPVLCMMLGCIVLRVSGKRYAWMWYVAVSLLSLLVGPDKEAAAVFATLGYYPMIKDTFEKLPLSWLWKTVYFNFAILALYGLITFVLGLTEVYVEFTTAGILGLILMLLLGNLTFFLLDRILNRFLGRR